MEPTTQVPAPSQERSDNPLRLAVQAAKALGVNLGPLIKNIFLPFLYALGLALFAGAGIGLSVILMHASKPAGIVLAAVILIAGLSGILYIGGIFGSLQVVISLGDARNQPVDYKQSWHDYRPLAWRFIGLQLLVGLMVFGGFLLLIIPSLIFSAWFSLAPFILIDQKTGIKEALSRSRQLARGHVFPLLAPGALLTISSTLTNFLPRYGVLFYPVTFVLSYAVSVMYAMLYVKYSQGSVAKNSPVNWILVVATPFVFAAIVLTSPLFNQGMGLLHPQTITTDCYKAKLSSYLRNPAVDTKVCSLSAKRGLDQVEVQAVPSSADSAHQFYDQQRKSILDKYGIVDPADNNSTDLKAALDQASKPQIKGSAVDQKSGDLEITAISFSQKNQFNGEIDFIRHPEGYVINGQRVFTFIVFQRNTGLPLFQKQSFEWQVNQYDQKLSAAWQAAKDAFNQENYQTVVDQGNLAISLAQTDFDRAPGYYWRGLGYNRQGKTALAESDERQAIKFDSQYAPPHVTLGSILDGRGDEAGALAEANQSINLDPNYGWGYNLRGVVEIKKGDKAAAVADFQKAVSLDSANPTFKQNLDQAQGS